MPRLKMTKAWFADTVTVDQRTDFDDEIVRGLPLRVSPSDSQQAAATIWNVRYFRDSDGGKPARQDRRLSGASVEKARQKRSSSPWP